MSIRVGMKAITCYGEQEFHDVKRGEFVMEKQIFEFSPNTPLNSSEISS